jgi:hypothetical protein
MISREFEIKSSSFFALRRIFNLFVVGEMFLLSWILQINK